MAAVPPPRRWLVAMWVVAGAAVLFAVHSLVRAAIAADVFTPPAGLPVTALSYAVPLALFVAFVVWANVTRSVVEGLGGVVQVVQNWAISVPTLVIFLSYVLPAKTPAAFHLGRAVAGLLLVAGLLISRSKLQRWLVEPASEPLPPVAPPRSAVPTFPRTAPLLPPVEVQPRDWDASAWDPEIQADIERRRRRD
ncbi:hypothetical protein OWR29_40745 [Actinoplanes sp. Pm04-4]|uniref:Uncharacterized protein n=1 Tax=Paractinoplanes pyxinae TaxID=2997416 RepID=A0ABT4BD11_9ACTN|nr:hypothetical protein [Actinoplanes pyxinae]MCY1144362.1 hypothetical protein [Actinoplanes pyxinae]